MHSVIASTRTSVRRVQAKRGFASAPSKATVITYNNYGYPPRVLQRQEVPLKAVGPNDVLVKFLAAPIHPSDLNMIQGQYDTEVAPPAVGGSEGVARVEAVGDKVAGKLSVGDHVVPARPGLGTWRTHGVFSSTDFFKLPKNNLSVPYQSTCFVNPGTALRLLEDFETLKSGDTLLVNGATGSVGQCLVQMANARGIKTISVLRSRAKFEDAVDHLKNIGSYIAVSEDYTKGAAFKNLISDLPAPKLALNAVGGTAATELIRHLGENGTLVTYGGMSRKPIQVPTSSLIFKNVNMRGFWLTKWVEKNGAEAAENMLKQIIQMEEQNQLKMFLETWNFDKFESALQAQFEPYKDRKIVLTME